MAPPCVLFLYVAPLILRIEIMKTDRITIEAAEEGGGESVLINSK